METIVLQRDAIWDHPPKAGLEEIDRYKIALDRSLGLKIPGHPEIKPFCDLRDAYGQITGDRGLRFKTTPRQVAEEALVASDFPGLLGRSMNRRIAQDYLGIDFHEDIFISHRDVTDNFAAQEVVHPAGYKDPPLVDPETTDYHETDKPTEEKSQYFLQIRGDLLSVSEMVLRGDDFGGLRRILRGRVRAYRRAFARFIWSFYADNAIFQDDGIAWFAAGHNNLFTDPLSPNAIVAMMTSIWNMVEPGSGEELGGFGHDQGLRFKLIVGRNLWFPAKEINERKYLDSDFTPNPVWRQFGEKNERIFVSPISTDVDNWGILCDFRDREIIEVKFLDGREEPEITIADGRDVGQISLHGKIIYKFRWSYGGTLVDFRNAAKSIVP